MEILQLKTGKQQQGLSMLLVLVLLSITISTSLFFHQRMLSSAQISGASRDKAQSTLLAESAMEMLRGGFINTLCSLPDCAVEGVDWQRVMPISGKMTDAAALDAVLVAAKAGYIFYVGAADQTSPNLLQRVANAGAGISSGAKCKIKQDSRSVGASNCDLDINALFGGASYGPLLYTTKENEPNTGLLVRSNQANWQAELNRVGNNGTAAAVWIELTVNKINPQAIDLWVQSFAIIGKSKTYLQRYLGTYFPPSGALGSVPSLVTSRRI